MSSQYKLDGIVRDSTIVCPHKPMKSLLGNMLQRQCGDIQGGCRHACGPALEEGHAKGLPPTTASLKLSLKEPRPVPPMLTWLPFNPLCPLDTCHHSCSSTRAHTQQKGAVETDFKKQAWVSRDISVPASQPASRADEQTDIKAVR